MATAAAALTSIASQNFSSGGLKSPLSKHKDQQDQQDQQDQHQQQKEEEEEPQQQQQSLDGDEGQNHLEAQQARMKIKQVSHTRAEKARGPPRSPQVVFRSGLDLRVTTKQAGKQALRVTTGVEVRGGGQTAVLKKNTLGLVDNAVTKEHVEAMEIENSSCPEEGSPLIVTDGRPDIQETWGKEEEPREPSRPL